MEFHTEDYVNFLKSVNAENSTKFLAQMKHCLIYSNCLLYLCLIGQTVNFSRDCPLFEGLFHFCQISAGGSVGLTDV